MNTAAISLQLRRDHMGVADRELHASGLGQRRNPRPSGFLAFLSQPSGLMVNCGRLASGPERRRTPRPSGFRAFPAQPSGVIVSCGRHASGPERRRTPRPSGFQASPAQPSGVMVSCGRHASGPERRRTPRPSGFRVSLAQPSGVMVSCGRHARGSTNAGLLLRAASTADVARAVRRTPHSSTERLHPAYRGDPRAVRRAP